MRKLHYAEPVLVVILDLLEVVIGNLNRSS